MDGIYGNVEKPSKLKMCIRDRYAWRNMDTDGEFCSLFRHRNGKHYLIFRTELYGYSVLEVESGQAVSYTHLRGRTAHLQLGLVRPVPERGGPKRLHLRLSLIHI